MSDPQHVAVIGAGVSGLTVAYDLARRGVRVTVLEQHDQMGGLARSITLGGAPIERFYHFICGADDHLKDLVGELGLGPRLHWLPSLTSYYVRGKLYPFTTPLDILRFSAISPRSRIRFGLHSARARGFTDWQAIEHLTAEEWLIDGMGTEAYETIWRPLLHVKFGSSLSRVSAPWIWHRIWRVATSRKSLLKPEELGYLEGGSLTLFARLAECIAEAGGTLALGQPVRGLLERGGKVVGVRTDEGDLEADAVVSTAALPALLPLLPESAAAYRKQLESIEFLGVLCLLMRTTRHLTPSFWVNVNDDRVPFNGFIEYSNLNPWRETGGSEVVYIPLYMPVTDPRFTRKDSETAGAMIAGLEAIIPGFDRSQVTEWVLSRDSYAQALCPPGFSKSVPDITSPVPGLYLTDSTQLYPADRNLSGMIGLAHEAARRVMAG